MENRKPMNLKNVLFAYNLALVILSAYMGYEVRFLRLSSYSGNLEVRQLEAYQFSPLLSFKVLQTMHEIRFLPGREW